LEPIEANQKESVIFGGQLAAMAKGKAGIDSPVFERGDQKNGSSTPA